MNVGFGRNRNCDDGRFGRGGLESSEARQAIEQVRQCIEAHGSARFDDLEDSDAKPANNRLGWRRGAAPEREWLVPPETWKAEVCAGLDPQFVARVLCERGMLRKGNDGFQCVRKIDGKNGRVYVLRESILAGGDDEARTQRYASARDGTSNRQIPPKRPGS